MQAHAPVVDHGGDGRGPGESAVALQPPDEDRLVAVGPRLLPGDVEAAVRVGQRLGRTGGADGDRIVPVGGGQDDPFIAPQTCAGGGHLLGTGADRGEQHDGAGAAVRDHARRHVIGRPAAPDTHAAGGPDHGSVAAHALHADMAVRVGLVVTRLPEGDIHPSFAVGRQRGADEVAEPAAGEDHRAAPERPPEGIEPLQERDSKVRGLHADGLAPGNEQAALAIGEDDRETCIVKRRGDAHGVAVQKLPPLRVVLLNEDLGPVVADLRLEHHDERQAVRGDESGLPRLLIPRAPGQEGAAGIVGVEAFAQAQGVQIAVEMHHEDIVLLGRRQIAPMVVERRQEEAAHPVGHGRHDDPGPHGARAEGVTLRLQQQVAAGGGGRGIQGAQAERAKKRGRPSGGGSGRPRRLGQAPSRCLHRRLRGRVRSSGPQHHGPPARRGPARPRRVRRRTRSGNRRRGRSGSRACRCIPP